MPRYIHPATPAHFLVNPRCAITFSRFHEITGAAHFNLHRVGANGYFLAVGWADLSTGAVAKLAWMANPELSLGDIARALRELREDAAERDARRAVNEAFVAMANDNG